MEDLLNRSSPFVPVYMFRPRLGLQIGVCPLPDEYLEKIRKLKDGAFSEIIFLPSFEPSEEGDYWLKIDAKIDARDTDGTSENVEITIYVARPAGESFCQVTMIYPAAPPVYLGANISGIPFPCVDELAIASLPLGEYVICPCGWHVVQKFCEREAANEALEFGRFIDYVIHPLAEP